MKRSTRGGIATLAIASAAFVAAGCGGSGGGSGAASAAKDSAALDLVPKDAIGYVTLDTDLEGENWEQFDDLAKAISPDFKGIVAEIEEEDETAAEVTDPADEGSDSDDSSEESGTDYEKDIDPWLGESAGAALLSVREGKGDDSEPEAEFFAWVELEDAEKFADYAKEEDEDLKEGDKIGDWETLTDGEETHMAYSDELAIITESREQLEETVEFDGDSITDADGVSDAVDEAGDDALMTFVASGDGVRKALESDSTFKTLAEGGQIDGLEAAAFSVAAEGDGMRLTGFVGAEGEDGPENVEHTVFESLPADTVFALGGSDFGGQLERTAEEAGEGNKQVQQVIGQATAALGVDVDDLAAAFDGEFVLGMAADDTGLGSLAQAASSAFGGLMMGAEGAPDLDPAELAKSATILLAFEETGESSETLDKLVGAAGGLAGGGTPKSGTAGDFETRTLDVMGFPLTTASSDDVAALAVGADVFDAWGDDTLGDADSYSAAMEAADAPGESAGTFWLDTGRIARLAGAEGGEDGELGGFVGWIESDGSNAKFGAFLHIDQK